MIGSRKVTIEIDVDALIDAAWMCRVELGARPKGEGRFHSVPDASLRAVIAAVDAWSDDCLARARDARKATPVLTDAGLPGPEGPW